MFPLLGWKFLEGRSFVFPHQYPQRPKWRGHAARGFWPSGKGGAGGFWKGAGLVARAPGGEREAGAAGCTRATVAVAGSSLQASPVGADPEGPLNQMAWALGVLPPEGVQER